MHEYPARWQQPEEQKVDHTVDFEERVLELLEELNLTIYSSGEDYDRALVHFFSQLNLLGQLIGAADLDDLNAFLRRNCRTF